MNPVAERYNINAYRLEEEWLARWQAAYEAAPEGLREILDLQLGLFMLTSSAVRRTRHEAERQAEHLHNRTASYLPPAPPQKPNITRLPGKGEIGVDYY